MRLAQGTSVWPAVWSAVAASCSAAIALGAWLIHRRTSRDSVRPEIEVEFGEIKNEKSIGPLDNVERWHGMVFITHVRNIGKGPAFDLTHGMAEGHGRQRVNQRVRAVHTRYATFPVLNAGEKKEVDWWPWVFIWDDTKPVERGRRVDQITLVVWASDSHGRRYEWRFQLQVYAPLRTGERPQPWTPTNLDRRVEVVARTVHLVPVSLRWLDWLRSGLGNLHMRFDLWRAGMIIEDRPSLRSRAAAALAEGFDRVRSAARDSRAARVSSTSRRKPADRP